MSNDVVNSIQDAATGSTHVWTAWIQMGFAGFSLVLVVFMMWFVKAFLKYDKDQQSVLMSLNTSITTNTEVTRSLGNSIAGLTSIVEKCAGPRPYVDPNKEKTRKFPYPPYS